MRRFKPIVLWRGDSLADSVLPFNHSGCFIDIHLYIKTPKREVLTIGPGPMSYGCGNQIAADMQPVHVMSQKWRQPSPVFLYITAPAAGEVRWWRLLHR